MKNKYFKFIIMTIIILVATIIIYGVSKIGKDSEKGPINNLSTTKIDCSEKIYINGTVQTVQSKNIYLEQSNGKIDSVAVKDGQTVSAGDVLFTYKNSDVQTQVADLNSQLATYNSQKSRLDTKKSDTNNALASKKNDLANLQSKLSGGDTDESIAAAITSTKSEIDGLNTQISSIDDQIATISDSITETNNKIATLKTKQNLSVKADVSGVVSIIGSIDDYTKAYMRIDSNDICVKGTVNEKYVKKLQVNQAVDAYIISDDRTVKGKISEVGRQPVTADVSTSGSISGQSSGSSLSNYNVTIILDSTEGLMDGFHVQATANQIDKDIIIPKKSVVSKDNSDYVFKVVNSKLEKVDVTMDKSYSNESNVKITNGLENGDKIVTNPSKTTKEGMKIE